MRARKDMRALRILPLPVVQDEDRIGGPTVALISYVHAFSSEREVGSL